MPADHKVWSSGKRHAKSNKGVPPEGRLYGSRRANPSGCQDSSPREPALQKVICDIVDYSRNLDQIRNIQQSEELTNNKNKNAEP